MSKSYRPLVGIVILVVGLAQSLLNGQSGGPASPAFNVEAAARSRAVQTELQRIDADRAAWVDAFLTQWEWVLDPAVYNVRSELGAIAMKAPAWQLYAASLVGDFTTMMQVLRGTRSAGAIVNSLAAPQPKMQPAAVQGRTVRPLVLGDTTNQLVFTPLAPCRVVDTRPGPAGNGIRTGPLPANATRDFDLANEITLNAQGGGPFPCPGLPVISPFGWAVNITVVSGLYSTAGGLKAWGFNSTEPNASVINWQAGQAGAIANGVILMGCFSCADDITIRAFGDATHVIIDVMGYFQEASATTATVSEFLGSSASVTPGQSEFVMGGSCPAGTVLMSGSLGYTAINANGLLVIYQSIGGDTRWGFGVRNIGTASETVTTTSRCLDAPVVIKDPVIIQ
jgi:hypothetical protein